VTKKNKNTSSEVIDYWVQLDELKVYVLAYVKGKLRLGSQELKRNKDNDSE
jgi:hypothetical protein